MLLPNLYDLATAFYTFWRTFQNHVAALNIWIRLLIFDIVTDHMMKLNRIDYGY